MNRKERGGSIKFAISLNEEQKIAKKEILDNVITVVKGEAGSGKTLLACQVALDLLLKKEIKKIIVTRPLVTTGGEELGHLPGDVSQKLEPYLLPIYDNFKQLYEKIEIDTMLEHGIIEICPIAFLRGRTFLNAVVILDEAQNCTHSQTEGLLGRLGKGSKMVICGDMSQCDLKYKKDSGFEFLDKLTTIPDFKIVALKQNHRHSIVAPILKAYRDSKD